MEFCSAAFDKIECYIVTDLLSLIDCDVLNLVTMSPLFCEVETRSVLQIPKAVGIFI